MGLWEGSLKGAQSIDWSVAVFVLFPFLLPVWNVDKAAATAAAILHHEVLKRMEAPS